MIKSTIVEYFIITFLFPFLLTQNVIPQPGNGNSNGSTALVRYLSVSAGRETAEKSEERQDRATAIIFFLIDRDNHGNNNNQQPWPLRAILLSKELILMPGLNILSSFIFFIFS